MDRLSVIVISSGRWRQPVSQKFFVRLSKTFTEIFIVSVKVFFIGKSFRFDRPAISSKCI